MCIGVLLIVLPLSVITITFKNNWGKVHLWWICNVSTWLGWILFPQIIFPIFSSSGSLQERLLWEIWSSKGKQWPICSSPVNQQLGTIALPSLDPLSVLQLLGQVCLGLWQSVPASTGYPHYQGQRQQALTQISVLLCELQLIFIGSCLPLLFPLYINFPFLMSCSMDLKL